MLPRWEKKHLKATVLGIGACALVLLANVQAFSQPLPGSTSGLLSLRPEAIGTLIAQAAEPAEPSLEAEVDRAATNISQAVANVTLGSLMLEAGTVLPDVPVSFVNPETNELVETSSNRLLGIEPGDRVFAEDQSLADAFSFGDVVGIFGSGTEIVSIATMGIEQVSQLAGVASGVVDSLPINQIGFLQELSLNDLSEVLDSEVVNDIAGGLSAAGDIADIANTAFGALDGDITLSDVSALATVALEQFPGISDAIVREIPFLADVPIGQIADIISRIPTIIRFDTLYGSPEGFTFDTRSGGFNPPPCDPPSNPEVDCTNAPCPHIEAFMFPLNTFFGRWVSGRAQNVSGGCGPLMAFNGGMEATGRHPFGSTFKLAIWDIDDTTDTLTTRIFFRICITIPFIGRTCTPYAIPPQGIPFIPFSRDSLGFA